MTTEVITDGPAQVGTLDAAILEAAAKEGISLPPVEAREGDALPSEDVADDATDTDPAKPDNIPDKFWKDGKVDVEALLASYGELEKKQAGEPAKPPVPADNSKPPETEQGKQVGDIVTKAGLEWSKLDAEWAAGNGSFTPETYKAFETVGVGKDLVDNYIKGQQAIGDADGASARSAAFAAAGGEKSYMDAIGWATTGLTAAQIVAFDKAVTGTDPAAAALAVQGLMAVYRKAGGSEPTNLGGNGKGGQGGGKYANVEQMIKDMQDPRYADDPAFRARVEAKVGRSDI